MSNFWQRAITGVLLVAVLITALIWSYATVAWLFFLLAVLGSFEFYKLTFQKLTIVCWIGVLMNGYIALIPFLHYEYQWNLVLMLLPVLPFISFSFIYELFALKKKPFQRVAYSIFPIFYVGMPFATLYTLGWAPEYNFTYNSSITLAFFTLIWSNDTFGYLVGKKLGKTKLFEKISPKKTWEGTLGSVAGTLTTGVVWSFYEDSIPLIHWIGMALIVAVFGSIGDLVQSSLKRSLKIKDSGNILPGHGGILDRFDAVIFAAPLVAMYLFLVYNAF